MITLPANHFSFERRYDLVNPSTRYLCFEREIRELIKAHQNIPDPDRYDVRHGTIEDFLETGNWRSVDMIYADLYCTAEDSSCLRILSAIQRWAPPILALTLSASRPCAPSHFKYPKGDGLWKERAFFALDFVQSRLKNYRFHPSASLLEVFDPESGSSGPYWKQGRKGTMVSLVFVR